MICLFFPASFHIPGLFFLRPLWHIAYMGLWRVHRFRSEVLSTERRILLFLKLISASQYGIDLTQVCRYISGFHLVATGSFFERHRVAEHLVPCIAILNDSCGTICIAGDIDCQVAYVSHVLAADRHFSLEQAEAICRHMGLRSDEFEFFLLLVEFDRAGTKSLKNYFEKQLQQRKEAYRQIKGRVGLKGTISSEDQGVYYSSWQFQAVRMVLTIPGFQRPTAIAERLGLSIEKVNDILEFFLSRGLVKETAKGYETTDTQIHVGADSPLIGRMHSNWRLHTMQILDRKNKDNLHYSAAVTLSDSDYQKVREILLHAITDSHKVIRPSKEEKLCLLSMDFYEL